jgi:hypothetical protein
MPDAREEKPVEATETAKGRKSAKLSAAELRARRKFWLVLAALSIGGVVFMLAPEAKGLCLRDVPWLYEPLSKILAPEATSLCLPDVAWPYELLSKFGDAMVIAAILAFAVDSYVKRSLVSEVAKEAIDFAVGYELPPEVKRHLVDDILRLPCVRRKLVFHYKFHEMLPGAPEHPDRYFRVICSASYVIVNLTDRPISFEVRSAVQKSHLPGLPPNELCRLHVEGPNAAGLPPINIDLKGDALYKKVDNTPGPYVTASQEAKIRPGENGALKVETERITYHRLEDSIFLDLLQPPSLGLDLKVTAPAGFAFEASFGAAGDPSPGHRDGSWSWNVPGVHLPGSHLYMTWHRVPTGDGATGQTNSTAVATPERA